MHVKIVKEHMIIDMNIISIKKNKEFEYIIKRGKFSAQKKIVVYVLKNNLKFNRLGIAISTKFGKATARNRLKRIIKEWYKKNMEKFRIGYDIIIVARKYGSEKVKARELFYNDYEYELKMAFRRLNLYKKRISEEEK
ncbi:ribonuclease P protein component [Caldicellulosiruptoraceae bacterium PP1]